MSALGRLLKRLWKWVRGWWARVRGFVNWLAGLAAELLGGLFDVWSAVKRLARSLKERVERLVSFVRDLVRRFFKSGSIDKVREPYDGANGVPLLAAISLGILWYGLPTARLLVLGRVQFILYGLALWFFLMVLWRMQCRRDRRASIARFAKSVANPTGLRRFDQISMLLAIAVLFVVRREVQLFPLAVAAAFAYFFLLIQPHEPRDVLPVPSKTWADGASGTPPVSLGAAGTVRELSWSVMVRGEVKHHSVRFGIDETEMQDAREINPGRGGSPQSMVEWVVGAPSSAVDEVARQIHGQCFEGGYSVYATISCFAAACQSIPYVPDSDSVGSDEYWRFPVETLADAAGDCEDSTILLAALLRRSGFRCVLVVFEDHVGIGVEVDQQLTGDYLEYHGHKYFFCETTADGWAVGVVPETLRQAAFELVPVPEWALV